MTCIHVVTKWFRGLYWNLKLSKWQFIVHNQVSMGCRAENCGCVIVSSCYNVHKWEFLHLNNQTWTITDRHYINSNNHTQFYYHLSAYYNTNYDSVKMIRVPFVVMEIEFVPPIYLYDKTSVEMLVYLLSPQSTTISHISKYT